MWGDNECEPNVTDFVIRPVWYPTIQHTIPNTIPYQVSFPDPPKVPPNWIVHRPNTWKEIWRYPITGCWRLVVTKKSGFVWPRSDYSRLSTDIWWSDHRWKLPWDRLLLVDGEVKYHLSRYLLGMILLERAHGLIAELRPTVVKRLKWRLKTFWCHISIPVSATAIFPNMVVKYRQRQKCVHDGRIGVSCCGIGGVLGSFVMKLAKE